MKKFSNYLLILSCLFSSIACEKQKTSSSKIYFDVDGYIKSESERLHRDKIRIKRIIVTGDKTEEAFFDAGKWNTNMDIFRNCDINKPALQNSYTIDSLIGSVVYTAKDSSLPVKELKVIFENQAVKEIIIRKSESNMYYKLYKTLNYTPGKGYKFISFQKTVISSPVIISAETIFIK